MTPYASYTPCSDTREIPAYRRSIPFAEQPTHEIRGLYLKPALTRYDTRPPARMLRHLGAVAGVAAAVATFYLGIPALYVALQLVGIAR